MHTLRTVLSEDIFTSGAVSAARVFKDPLVIDWMVTGRPIPIDMNTVGVTPIYNTQVMIGIGTSVSPIRKWRQEIDSPRV